MKCEALINDSPIKQAPPPPQLFLGDLPPVLPEFRSGEEPNGDGSVKNNKLSILFIAATQTLLSLLFVKFI